MKDKFLFILLLISSCDANNGMEFKLCRPGIFMDSTLALKITSDNCKGCEYLENCTTYEGNIQIQIVRKASQEVMNKLRFPKLREITGYLLVSLVYGERSLKNIFPKLAVIRGKKLFLNYALVVYQNDGLQEINLPSLTTILDGGVRIEKNIHLCYVKTIRWESIMQNGNSLYLGSNNHDCYDTCFRGKCSPPAGHGRAVRQYCWAPGHDSEHADCQSLCNKVKCGDRGCLEGNGNSELCCNEECLGGCTQLKPPHGCYACRHFREMQDGKCVKKCQVDLFEVDGFRCESRCPSGYLKLEIPGESKKCVKACPAGYQPDSTNCIKCETVKCPRVCKARTAIEGLGSLPDYKGCTEINGDLIITIRGSGVSGIGRKLEEHLGKIEKVKGYIVIRECSSVTSLNFLKNLKEIEPRSRIFGRKPILYNDRYALAILDNPKLEAMWPFQHNLNISTGGIMVHLNPFLCPGKISPLVNDILKWNRSDTRRSVDISDTTNGNAAACDVQRINVTLEEVDRATGRKRCNSVCMKVEWDEVPIADYRNVLFYTVSYREAPHRQITEYDGQDACSQGSENAWTRQDYTVEAPGGSLNDSLGGRTRKLVMYIQKLKPFKLYAFQVEAVVLKNVGAKSSLVFIQTKEKVPSQPVGPEANFINSSALLVKWEPPLFPNGYITKYSLKYELSDYSPWEQVLNWCDRTIFTGDRDKTNEKVEKDNNKSPNGTCMRNITCNCDEKAKEKERPEKQSALFAKEFQDKLLRTIFTKENDDKNPATTRSTVVSTTPLATSHSANNCSNDAQNPLCQVTTVPQDGTTTESSKVPATTGKPTSTNLVLPTSTAPSHVPLDLNATQNSVVLTKLKHFSDYRIEICACTKVGCASASSCAVIKGMTDKKHTADDLVGDLVVDVNNKTRQYNVSWNPPKDPNGVVLRYDVEIKTDVGPPLMQCRDSKHPYYEGATQHGANGNYSIRVRAITPAGNGSWSPVALFSMQKKVTNAPVEETNSLPVGTVVGASLASSAVFVLACGFLIWYFARKRYKRYTDETIPGVLYASVNPEYMTTTDVYIADEWEFPREKIKLVRELGNGSFGMVYEGEAEEIIPNAPSCRVAVKTVSENASLRDRVEFLQEASVMKHFSSNHVVRLLGVVSEGQPTLVIMELMELGDLKNFLRSRRPGEGSLPTPTLQELLQMAGEIADGMAYLAARKYVHRDLAARNCMVNSNYTVKIGDFGMTRDIYETDYYRKGGKGLLPVRWMAPESLRDGVFTSNSDVWSFGVVMWEMATLACQPYPGKSNEEVLKFVVDGGLMEKPEECPDKLYDMMALCWQYNAKARPTFVYLISLVEADLADTFRELSFYHTLPEDQLKGLLSSHYKHKNKTETADSTLNVEA